MRLALALLVPLLLAGPASAAGAVGVGTGQAAFTICFNFNYYEFHMVGVEIDGVWTMVVSRMSFHPQCQPSPTLVMTGAWAPAAGGCGLRNAEYQLCLDPVTGAGVAGWRMCQAREPVCDDLYQIWYGTVTLAAA